MPALADYDVRSLETQFESWGCKASHARRALRAFYDGAGDVDWDTLDVGRELRSRFRNEEIRLRQSQVLSRQSGSDGTTKMLVGFPEGGDGAVECVLMPGYRPDRAAACVSSQVGCAMGCDFCASTRRGLGRNLTAGEIVEQFLHLREAARLLGRRLTSLVFMGMGEPMHNFDAVIAAVRRIADAAMGAIGWRQVTVSTVGIVPGIDRLADAGLNVNLAVSIHAPDDEARARIVPAGRRYPLTEIVAATRRFHERTGRIPTIEYCLLAGVNDSDEQACALARLLTGLRAHVNLIPYNTTGPGLSGVVYRRPSREQMVSFLETLRGAGVVAHFRDTRGDDVDAACGQLRETVLNGRTAPYAAPQATA